MITGRQIGGYEIQEELGRGAMGVVFKARQVSMDRIVAIKFLPKRLAQDERIVARFLREARAAGQLSHPNIVSVHELGMADGLHFIAMEFVDGNSIQKKLKEKGPFNEKDALEIAGQIAEALRMAHSRGILHRDIKPDNFLIDAAGRVRLADLGLASIESAAGGGEDGSLTQDGTTLGTPHFMSPEQCSGSGTDARSDLYSLGASLFVMCSGRTPYDGNTAAAVMVKVLTEQPAVLKKLRPELSAGFVALVEKFMQKEPSKRFQNAGEASEAITLCKSGLYKPPAQPAAAGAKAPQKNAPAKAAAGQAARQHDALPNGRTGRQDPSKLIPLLVGGAAALALIVVLALYKSHGAATAPQPAPPVISKLNPPAARGTLIETSGANVPPVPGIKVPDESRVVEKPRQPNPNSPAVQFYAIDDALTSGRMKLGEAVRRIRELRAQHQAKIENQPGLLRRLRAFEVELAKRGETITADWKKLDAATGADVKNSVWQETLPKLAQFKADNEGLEEATKAAEKIDAVVTAQLAFARRLADSNNPRAAATLLSPLAELAILPEKNLSEIKAAIALYTGRGRSAQELAAVYEQAWALVVATDRLEKKNFQFSDAIRFCAESASKARSEDSKHDLGDLGHAFEAARNLFYGLRDQVNAGRTVELPNLPGFFKSRVTIVRWSAEEILFTPADISQPQPLSLYSASAPDAILAIALEAKKSQGAAGLWEAGLLAFAFGNQNLAGKHLRDALGKDDSLASRGAAPVILKLLKPVELAAPEKVPDPAVAQAALREKDAEQCLKDMQDALREGDKVKFAASRVELASKFADTEYFKSHKKEIDELAAATPPAAPVPEVPKPVAIPDKVKPDMRTPQDKEAQEALARLGWPPENISGSWTLLDKKNNVFKVDGIGELSCAALDGDIDVGFQLLDPTAKLRVLTRVDKLPADHFAQFGADKGTGFGADISASNVYVYLDPKLSKIPVLFGSPIKIANWKLPHQVHVRHRDGELAVTFDDGQPKKNSGEARNVGEIRVIVSGPLQLIPKLINPAKQ